MTVSPDPPSSRRERGILDVAVAVCVVVSLVGVISLVMLRTFVTAQDTTELSNTALVLMMAFTALAFGYTQVIDDDRGDRAVALVAGELSFFASILFFLASVIKHVRLNDTFRPSDKWLADCMALTFMFLFMLAAGLAHLAIWLLLDVLKSRIARDFANRPRR